MRVNKSAIHLYRIKYSCDFGNCKNKLSMILANNLLPGSETLIKTDLCKNKEPLLVLCEDVQRELEDHVHMLASQVLKVTQVNEVIVDPRGQGHVGH